MWFHFPGNSSFTDTMFIRLFGVVFWAVTENGPDKNGPADRTDFG